jgi:Flp pilus assembly protein TadG
MLLRKFANNQSGSFTSTFALTFSTMLMMAGMAVDFSVNQHAAQNLQEIVDGAVLAGAATPGTDDQKLAVAREQFEAALSIERGYHRNATGTFTMASKGVLLGAASMETPMLITGAFLDGPLKAGVTSKASFSTAASSPCINILGDQNNALQVNGGATIQAPDCEVQVHTKRNPSMIMNGGSVLNVKKICMAGDKFIRNGGSIGPIVTNCAVTPDPYFQKLPEPVVSNICATSNTYNPGTYTIKAGVHCSPTFNGSPVLNFAPGLHIIKGRFTVNSGSTINAPGVTFYFVDADSEIRANGSLTMTATAPASGPYAGILMFEKTSDAANNKKKQQYIFNGSMSERLEGVIYLPNRNVTYNSKTNVSGNKTSIYVNTMLINSASWKLFPTTPAGGADEVRLTQ